MIEFGLEINEKQGYVSSSKVNWRQRHERKKSSVAQSSQIIHRPVDVFSSAQDI
jgi:hypothetical protein